MRFASQNVEVVVGLSTARLREPMAPSTYWLKMTLLLLIGQIGGSFADNDELQTLLQLKVAWGPSKFLDAWTGTSYCQWNGISCDSSPDQHVTEMRLSYADLNGQLSPLLANLSQLKVLQLQYNPNLKGPIPKEIGNMANLQTLDLSFNGGLGGTIPAEIGKLKSLQKLDLQSCSLVGPLPATITSLTNLTYLSVMHNGMNGSIPTGISNLKNLYWFELAQNGFSGPLPDELGNMTAIQHLHFYNNSFSGSIPRSLANLPNLIHIVMYNNKLSGQLPHELGDIAMLKIIELSDNNFGGPLPNDVGNLQKLEQLVCRRCGLQGTLPSLPNMPSLLYVDLSFNSLSGQYPDFLTSSPLLQEINLEQNSFTAELRVANKKVWLFGNPVCASSNDDVCQSSVPQYPAVVKCPQRPPKCTGGMFSNPNLAGCTCQFTVNATITLISPPWQTIPYRIDEIESGISSAVGGVEKTSVHVYGFDIKPHFVIKVQLFPPFDQTIFTPLRVSELVQKVRNITQAHLPGVELGVLVANPEPFDLDLLTGTGSSNKGLKAGAIAGIILAAIVALVIIAVLILFAYHQKRRADEAVKSQTYKSSGYGYDDNSATGGPTVKQPKRFAFQELVTATDDFAAANAIGRGGYGNVYKGVLANGQAVAVKRSAKGSTQGAAEFNMEVELLSRVHHKNLVDLVGYCLDNGEELLVYEYMENGTIRENIITKVETPLTFGQRIEIALGSARGLQYLHEGSNPPIIHRDIKSSNILLDSKMVAKVADFGLCKVAEEMSAHSTHVKGTQGYLDPEYYRTQQITTKSDVYSFGVVTLELMTGRQPLEPRTSKFIVTEVKNSLKAEGGVHKFADPKMGKYPRALFERVVALALHCVADDGENRPTMREIVGLLEEIEGAVQNGTGTLGRRMTPSLENIDDFSSETHHVMRSPFKSTTNSDMNTSASSDFYCSGIVATDLRVEPK